MALLLSATRANLALFPIKPSYRKRKPSMTKSPSLRRATYAPSGLIFSPPRMGKSLGLILALSALTQPALAGYTVMDDDLFPTNAIPASVAAARAAALPPASQSSTLPTPSRTAPLALANSGADGETYSILFRRGIWGLNAEGAAAVTELLPLMQGRPVIVTGYPDATPNKYLADQRAAYLRKWLIRNGIPADKIETRTKDVNNTPVNNQFPVEIQIGGGALQPQSPIPVAKYQPQLPSGTTVTVSNGIRTTITPMLAQPTAPTSTVAIIATPSPDTRIDMIRQIAIASQAGRIDPKAAVATIIELLANSPALPLTQPAPRVAPAAKPAPAPVAEFGLIAAAETARPKEWLLSSEKTLKDNTADWAKKEGYELDWKASNYFRVGRSQPVPGELLEVIDRVTSAAGLKMEVWKKDRLIRVSDRPQ